MRDRDFELFGVFVLVALTTGVMLSTNYNPTAFFVAVGVVYLVAVVWSVVGFIRRR